MDIDAFTKPFQLVKQIRRDVYPAIDPSNPDLSVSGKVVLITGAGGQIGGVSICILLSELGLDAVAACSVPPGDGEYPPRAAVTRWLRFSP